MSTEKHTRAIYAILILLLIGSISVFIGILYNNILITKELNRLKTIEENTSITIKNYAVLHDQFRYIMNCSLIMDRSLDKIFWDVYDDVLLDIGEDKYGKLYHIYAQLFPQTFNTNPVITVTSKKSEFHLKNTIIACHGEHVVTLHDNMDITISGITPLKLRTGIPLISYRMSDVYTKMIYKNDMTSVMIRSSGLSSRSTYMHFYNYTNIDLPNEYCLTSVSPVEFNPPGHMVTSRIRQGDKVLTVTLVNVQKPDIDGFYIKMCFDFEGSSPYISYGSEMLYST